MLHHAMHIACTAWLAQLLCYYAVTSTTATPRHTPACFTHCCPLQTHSTLIKRTSAVTTTVLGEIKIVGLLVLSAVLLGELKCATVGCSAGLVLTRSVGGPSCSRFSLPRSACAGESKQLTFKMAVGCIMALVGAAPC